MIFKKELKFAEHAFVEIEFLDGKGCIVETGYSSFLEGAVKNYKRVEYGFHGYIDQGPYETITRDDDGKKIFLTEYNTWVPLRCEIVLSPYSHLLQL